MVFVIYNNSHSFLDNPRINIYLMQFVEWVYTFYSLLLLICNQVRFNSPPLLCIVSLMIQNIIHYKHILVYVKILKYIHCPLILFPDVDNVSENSKWCMCFSHPYLYFRFPVTSESVFFSLSIYTLMKYEDKLTISNN